LELGEKIKDLREKHGLTLKQLEEISGVSDSYISKIENGTSKNVSVDSLRALAKALHVSVTYLIEETAVTFEELAKAHNITLPEDVATFIANEKNTPYLVLAKRLEEQKIPLEYIEVAIEAVRSARKKAE
jgi:transcriptional regulator with XRE-family HTH domain